MVKLRNGSRSSNNNSSNSSSSNTSSSNSSSSSSNSSSNISNSNSNNKRDHMKLKPTMSMKMKTPMLSTQRMEFTPLFPRSMVFLSMLMARELKSIPTNKSSEIRLLVSAAI